MSKLQIQNKVELDKNTVLQKHGFAIFIMLEGSVKYQMKSEKSSKCFLWHISMDDI